LDSKVNYTKNILGTLKIWDHRLIHRIFKEYKYNKLSKIFYLKIYNLDDSIKLWWFRYNKCIIKRICCEPQSYK